jgi:hypothetical protein
MEWVPGNPNDRSVYGFRVRHGGRKGPMSKTKYFAMKKAGRGPREMELNGTIIITAAAEAEWERVNGAPKGALAQLVAKEAAMRKRRARQAGAAARQRKSK